MIQMFNFFANVLIFSIGQSYYIFIYSSLPRIQHYMYLYNSTFYLF